MTMPSSVPSGVRRMNRWTRNADDQPLKDAKQRKRSRSRDRVHPHARAQQAPQVPTIQPMVFQEVVIVPD